MIYNKERKCYEENGKDYRKVTKTEIYTENGKKYTRDIKVFEEIKPFWGDGWRNSHPINPTEKAPSFKTH